MGTIWYEVSTTYNTRTCATQCNREAIEADTHCMQ